MPEQNRSGKQSVGGAPTSTGAEYLRLRQEHVSQPGENFDQVDDTLWVQAARATGDQTMIDHTNAVRFSRGLTPL